MTCSLSTSQKRAMKTPIFGICCSIILFQKIDSGLVVGENGLGQYTKNSAHQNRDEEISEGSLPSVYQQNLDISRALPQVARFEEVLKDNPDHQQLINPPFQLLTEWPCADPSSECREQLKVFLKKLNEVRRTERKENPNICEQDFHILHVGKAIRMSLHGTVNTFNVIVDNFCGDIAKCNICGFMDEFGTLKNFDYDCIADVEALEAREAMRIRREKDRFDAAKSKIENIEKVRMLGENSRSAGWKMLEDRDRHL